jgi:hypothetical protein
MENYTLKQKLKALNILILERNGLDYTHNYTAIMETLTTKKDLYKLTLDEVQKILTYCTEKGSRDLNAIFTIFASNEAERLQIHQDFVTITKFKEAE